DSYQAADVGVEPSRSRAVETHHGLSICPRAIEQAREAMMEDVREAAERGIAVIQLAAMRVLGQMQRQRPVRSEHAEEIRREIARSTDIPGLEAGDARRGEAHRRLLPEANRLVHGTRSRADARLVRVQALELP